MNIKGTAAGTLLAAVFTFLCLLVCALLAYFGIITERTASLIVFFGAAAGIFAGALCAARAAEGKRLLNAMSVSVMFAIIIYIASVSVNGGFALHARTAALLSACGASGIAGALFGRR